MKVFVIAMESEANCVISNMTEVCNEKIFGRDVIKGKLKGEDALIVISGIGKSNAAAATQLALSLTNTDAIYNLGLCGGVDKSGGELELGEIYEVSEASQYDFDLSELDKPLSGILDERDTRWIPCAKFGQFPLKRLATGDRFTNNHNDSIMLKEYGANLRDMEGAAIAHICERAGVKFYSFKCVSDLLFNESPTNEYKEYFNLCIKKLTDFVKTF